MTDDYDDDSSSLAKKELELGFDFNFILLSGNAPCFDNF